MKCNKKLSRVTEFLKDPERGRFLLFLFSLSWKINLELANVGAIM